MLKVLAALPQSNKNFIENRSLNSNVNLKNTNFLSSQIIKNIELLSNVNSTKITLNYNNLLGFIAPFTKVFVIRGIGYQADVIEDSCSLPEFSFNRYLSLRVGHSFLIYKAIPNYISVKVHKKERKLIIYGVNKEHVANFSKIIYKLRPPSVYTGRGIRIKKGSHRRKLGKKDIRKGKV